VPPAESPLATVLGTAAKAADDAKATISAKRRRNVRQLLGSFLWCAYEVS
jgi:hypothetical protein